MCVFACGACCFACGEMINVTQKPQKSQIVQPAADVGCSGSLSVNGGDSARSLRSRRNGARGEVCGKGKGRAAVMEVSASSQTHKLRDAVCSIPSCSICSILRQAAGAGEFPFRREGVPVGRGRGGPTAVRPLLEITSGISNFHRFLRNLGVKINYSTSIS